MATLQDVQDYRNHLIAQGYNPKDVDEYVETELKPKYGLSESTWDKTKDVGLKGLEYLGRGLDYLGSGVRGGVANALEAATGKDVIKDDESMFKGNAPSSSQIMERLGVPEAGTLSDIIPSVYNDTGKDWKLKKGGMLDPSTRGAAGFALDVATDPLTYGTFGMSTLGKAGKGLKALKVAEEAGLAGKGLRGAGNVLEGAGRVIDNPLDVLRRSAASGLKDSGEGLYKSGFKEIDSRLAEKGQDAISPYMLEQGFWGGRGALLNKIEKRTEELGALRDKLYSKADELGAFVPQNAATENASKYLNDLEYKGFDVDALRNRVERYNDPKLIRNPDSLGFSIQQASDIKSALYDQLPASAFDINGRLTAHGKELLQKLAQGFKEGIVNAAEGAQKGLGSQISDVNREWGALLNATKPTQKELAKSQRRNFITEVKAGVATASPKAAAAMYGAKALNSPWFKTGVGLGMERVGQGLGSDLLTNALNNAYVRPVTRRGVWEMLDGGEGK